MNFSRHNFEISEHFASALINGDYTGLSDDDDKALQVFTDNAHSAHGLGFWDTDPKDWDRFRTCEITGLQANCINVQYLTERK